MDIISPTQQEEIRAALEAHTGVPWNLEAVDNGSRIDITTIPSHLAPEVHDAVNVLAAKLGLNPMFDGEAFLCLHAPQVKTLLTLEKPAPIQVPDSMRAVSTPQPKAVEAPPELLSVKTPAVIAKTPSVRQEIGFELPPAGDRIVHQPLMAALHALIPGNWELATTPYRQGMISASCVQSLTEAQVEALETALKPLQVRPVIQNNLVTVFLDAAQAHQLANPQGKPNDHLAMLRAKPIERIKKTVAASTEVALQQLVAEGPQDPKDKATAFTGDKTFIEHLRDLPVSSSILRH